MIKKEILDAIDLLTSLKVGDKVEVAEGGRQLTTGMYVSREARRSDGAYGSVESTHVTVTYGPGRYATEIHADSIGNGRWSLSLAPVETD